MNKSSYIILILILLVSSSIFAVSYYQNSAKKDTREVVLEENKAKPLFIGCREQRDWLDVEDKTYIACDGGVVIFNKNTKKIVKYITMADGLSNEFITSLVKYKNNLYIGSQDGITIYNLDTNKSKIINTKNGLSNGANIKLLLDKETLWIATFDGLDSINLDTNKITQHKESINSGQGALNVVAIEKLDKYIYISVLGSDKSNAYVARLDKGTGKWEIFDSSDFKKTNRGVNIYDFYATDSAIYALDLFNTYEAFDKTFLNLQDNNSAWKQSPPDNTWQNIDETDKENIREAYNAKNISNVDLGTDLTTNKIWHVVNSNVITGGGLDLQNTNVVILDHKTLNKNIIKSNTDSLIYFEPIEYTNLSVAIYQSCGQGCSQPKLFLHNYVTNTMDQVSIPIDNIKEVVGYPFVKEFISSEMRLTLVDTKNLVEESFKLDTLEKKLTKISSKKIVKLPDLVHPIKTVSNVYDFNSRFTLARRLVTAEGKEDINKLGITYTANDEFIKLKLKGKEYTLRMLPKRYSPFPDWLHTIEVRKVQIDENVLFVSSDRGVIRIDTNTGVTTLFGPKDGLISPNVKDFIFVDGKLITTYNGISVVK